MKRSEYIVSYGDQSFVKYKWNSAIREIERVIGYIANFDKSTYNLIDSGGEKLDGNYVKGFRTWRSDKGHTVTFNIVKSPNYEVNPMKKPTAKQIAARKLFAARAKAGYFSAPIRKATGPEIDDFLKDLETRFAKKASKRKSNPANRHDPSATRVSILSKIGW
jgi:hypothetical protein